MDTGKVIGKHGSCQKPFSRQFFTFFSFYLPYQHLSLGFVYLIIPFSRQESQYEMTGLYSDTQDDSSADIPQDTETESLPSSIATTSTFHQVQTHNITVSTTLANPAVTTTAISTSTTQDTVIKCHSRQPSASLMDRDKAHHNDDIVDDELLNDCGIFNCRPAKLQKLARIKVRCVGILLY